MRQKELQNTCIDRFGQNKGIRLANLILKISKLDFCVATAWEDDEVSISRGCDYIGKIFKISSDYKNIFSPSGTRMDLNKAQYKDIAQYLPKARFIEGRTHCQSDIYKKKK